MSVTRSRVDRKVAWREALERGLFGNLCGEPAFRFRSFAFQKACGKHFGRKRFFGVEALDKGVGEVRNLDGALAAKTVEGNEIRMLWVRSNNRIRSGGGRTNACFCLSESPSIAAKLRVEELFQFLDTCGIGRVRRVVPIVSGAHEDFPIMTREDEFALEEDRGLGGDCRGSVVGIASSYLFNFGDDALSWFVGGEVEIGVASGEMTFGKKRDGGGIFAERNAAGRSVNFVVVEKRGQQGISPRELCM